MRLYQIELQRFEVPGTEAVETRNYTVKERYKDKGRTTYDASAEIEGKSAWVDYDDYPDDLREKLEIDEVDEGFARALQAVSALTGADNVLSKQVIAATLTYGDPNETTADP